MSTKYPPEILKNLCDIPTCCILPICLTNLPIEESKVFNGTMTLIDFDNYILGITCYHVLESYQEKRESDENIKFYLADLEIPPDNYLLDESKSLDLATFKFDKNEKILQRIKSKEIENFGMPYPHDNIYYDRISMDQRLILSGFPGEIRNQPTKNHIICASAAFGPCKIHAAHQDRIICQLDNIHTSGIKSVDIYKKKFTSAGGMSGGPVFISVITKQGILYYKLGGIIYEGHFFDDTLILYIRPLTFIKSDGTINKNNNFM